MKRRTCDRESQTLAEARQGSLSDSTRDHLEACEICSTAAHVDGALAAEADLAASLARLPDPTLIWWSARQQAQRHQAEKATLPIQIAERLALALGAVGLFMGLSLTWPTVQETLAQWLAGWAKGLTQMVPMEGSAWILALTGSLFLLVGFGLYSQWAEE